jgi:3-oxoacyl-[acyl-carrier protein] reductase
MNNIAIITGASHGIGKATAHTFIAHGWEVINLARSSCDLAGVINLNVDLTDLEQLQQQKPPLATLLSNKPRIALIHNAALFHKDTIASVTTAALHTSFAVSITAPAMLNQMLLPYMPTGSAIIYVGSTLSEKAVAHAASYVISKHAVVGMMRATCQDLANSGIHSCCVCPGFTNTEMLRHHVQNDDHILNMLAQRVGANRLIEPQEIADTLYFCATHPVINGSVIHAHLGQIEN